MAAFSTPPPTSEHSGETLHGIQVSDPYRWLEDQNSSATRAWLSRQADYTRSYFEGLPGRERLRRKVAQLLAVTTYREPHQAGERCFFLKRTAHQEQPALCMREGGSQEDILLLRPDAAGKHTSAIDICAISATGRYIAFHKMTDGRDVAAIGFLDVERRQVFDEELPPGIFGGMVFSEERGGFYYVHQPVAASVQRQTVRWHSFGSAFECDEEILSLKQPAERLIIAASDIGERFLYRVLLPGDPMRSDFYLHDVKRALPKRILSGMSGIVEPFFAGEQLLAFTDYLAPNRRIVAIDTAHPAPENWSTVIDEGDLQIEQCRLAGSKLCLVYQNDLSHELRVFNLNGEPLRALPSISPGTIELPAPCGPAETLFYQTSSFAVPATIFRYQAEKDGCARWAGDAKPIDGVTLRRVEYPGKDGTLIPMLLLSREGVQNCRPGPVFLSAYGGFGLTVTPRFTVHVNILLQLGCTCAVAHVRGGAEFGRHWHEAAKRRKRQIAIDDFVAAGEWLMRQGIAAPARLAIGGGSNAGLLVGAALTQRPELFRAVICLGPLLDMLRYHKFDFAHYWIDEYGCAEVEEDFHALLAYSPYHRVCDGAKYPAVLLVSGDADTRCNPMHARKMAARLQAATGSGRPVLLDYRPAWGHMPVQPLTRRIDALTDRLMFLCHELGLQTPEAW